MIIEKIKPSDPNHKSKKLLEQQVEKQILRGKKIKFYKERELKKLQKQEILDKIQDPEMLQ